MLPLINFQFLCVNKFVSFLIMFKCNILRSDIIPFYKCGLKDDLIFGRERGHHCSRLDT